MKDKPYSHEVKEEMIPLNSFEACPWTSKKLILIMGKGGVGKTVVADAVARSLAKQNKKTLLCHILQMEGTKQSVTKPDSTLENLSEITLNSLESFQEYIHLKLPIKTLANVLINSKVIQYFEKAAPGVRELVLLGKLWHVMNQYDHVVVDMPSTGYALTMIHTPFNFSKLFPLGPISADSNSMIKDFSNPNLTAIITVALPEEMPLQESYDLQADLKQIMPLNHPWLVVNRCDEMSNEESKLISTIPVQDQTNVLFKAMMHRKIKIDKQIENMKSIENNWDQKPWIKIREFHG